MPQPTEPDIEDAEPDYSYLVPPEAIPDTSKIIVSDGVPRESIFAQYQADLLIEPLYASWKNPSGLRYLAVSNVGLFATANGKPLVPDMMLSLDVPANIPHDNPDYKAYFSWIIGKMPEVVIEIMSARRAKEHSVKKVEYEKLFIPYFVIFDPENVLGEGELQIHQMKGGIYERIESAWLPVVGLGLCVWTGEYYGCTRPWLRWCDAIGDVIPTGKELTVIQIQRKNKFVEINRQLIEKLKAAGIDPT